jgi:cation:H+ antiporter
MQLFPVLQIIIGFIVLAKASEFAINRASAISRHFGLSEYIIGFIAVGLLSVLPELGISIISAFEGEPQFGLGILFGSNIADLTLVIGIVAIFAGQIKMRDKLIKKADKLLLSISMPTLLLLDGELSAFDGCILLFCFALYAHGIITSEHPLNKQVFRVKADVLKEIVMLFAAVIVILVSGHFITDGAKILSLSLSLPLFVIGVVLAIGTCTPELIFSINAARKNKLEIGFGDIIGNVFADATAVAGIIAIISPIRPNPPEMAITSGIFMSISLAILMFIFNQKGNLGKKAGVLLIIIYIIFLIAQFFIDALLLY